MFNLPNHIKILDYDLMVDKKISNEYIIFKRFVYIGRIQVKFELIYAYYDKYTKQIPYTCNIEIVDKKNDIPKELLEKIFCKVILTDKKNRSI